MRKVIYNACHGGFGLSVAALKRYAELKELHVWEEGTSEWDSTYWLVPPINEERIRCQKIQASWHKYSPKERQFSSKFYKENTLDNTEICRHDPVWVQVVEELGKKAGDDCAELRIAEVEGKYRINEYDGLEHVETPESIDWE